MSLTLLNIDIGDLANDGTGDPLRVAFEKINNNFSTISSLDSGGVQGSVQFKSGNIYSGSANLVFDSAVNFLKVNGTIIPPVSGLLNLGEANARINELFVGQGGLNVGNINIGEDGNIIFFPTKVDPNVFSSLSGIQNIALLGNISLNKSLVIGLSSPISAQLSKLTASYITTTNAPNQDIFTTPIETLNAATFKINSIETNSFNQQSVTINVTKRPGGASVNFVAYSTQFVGTPITRYNVDVAFGNLRVQVSPIPNSTIGHKIYMELES